MAQAFDKVTTGNQLLEGTTLPKSKKRKTTGEAQRRAKAQERQSKQPPADHAGFDTPQVKYDADGERMLFNAGLELWHALETYKEAVLDYEQRGCLELDEQMKSLAWAGDGLHHELHQLMRAIDVIEDDIPIAAQSKNGKAWTRHLSPKWLLYFLDLAKPGDTGYIPQLTARLEKAKARELDAKCGRINKAGTPCQAIPVYWPGRGRDSACTRHLSADEKTSLEKVWADIEATHDCPGCSAMSGQPCSLEASDLVLVDGEWPRIRAFNGRQVHDARLALV